MVGGLMHAGHIRRPAWAPSMYSRAAYAQSPVRRLARGLEPARLDVPALARPLIPHALAEWGTPGLSLALDTSTWWQTACLVRLSLV